MIRKKISIFCVFCKKPNHFPAKKYDFFDTKICLVSNSSESDGIQPRRKPPFQKVK